MRWPSYILRSVHYYRKPQLAALAGASLATAALTGALLTGDSVRTSLRRLAVQRLGATEYLLASRSFFRDQLAEAMGQGSGSAPIISLEAHASNERTGQRALAVDLHGIDARFYQFHGASTQPPEGRDAMLSPGLARELGVRAGDTLLLRIEMPSAIPREFLYGQKEETSRVLRFRVAKEVTPAALSDFALRPRQGEVHAVFVPIDRLRRDLGVGTRANAVLLGAGASREMLVRRLQENYSLEDIGLRLSSTGSSENPVTILEHESTVLDDRTAARAISVGRDLQILTRPFLTYLANSVRRGERQSAYALVAAADAETLAELNGDKPLPSSRLPAILLTEWLAADLGAETGDSVNLEYFVWEDTGTLATNSASFTVAGVIPMRGLAADRRIAPEYPGITDQTSVAAWDPPFPINLKLVTPRDELYWKLYRATPKAWVLLEAARPLWATRFGSYTSIRFAMPAQALAPVLRASLDPLDSQFTLLPVRQQALESSRGATDFGEYFLYFSFVLVVSALLLMGLFCRLAIEQRSSEIALLRALGIHDAAIRRLFLAEGGLVALAGVIAGTALSVGWAWFMIEGLRRWWSGATGTRLLTLHIDLSLLAAGAFISFVAALLALWLALRRYEGLLPRQVDAASLRRSGFAQIWIGLFLSTVGALTLFGLSAAGIVGAAAGFFGGAFLLLAAFLLAVSLWLQRPSAALKGQPGLWRLAVRNAAWRPGRSVLCIALVALASFLLASLEAFRQDERGASGIWAESLAPIVQDPRSLDGLPPVKWTSFRLRPGDDISCLNLYEPRNPRILGVPPAYYRSNPLPITASLARSEETARNPWLLLDSQLEKGVVPAIVDQNSMDYILHKRLGDSIEIERAGAAPLKLRIVATTAPGLFQSEVLIAERDFTRLFPDIPGWRVFLIDAPAAVIEPLEESLAAYGFDAQPVADRLASFHRVENTYLSTFQTLGGFGLLIGVFGLAAVMLRNVLERRAELALLAAVGFDTATLQRLILYENLVLLGAGLAAGSLCALLAVAPALATRGAILPLARISLLLASVLLAGAIASWLAVRATAPARLIAALRS